MYMPKLDGHGPDWSSLEIHRLSVMIFLGGRHEVQRDSWKANIHDIGGKTTVDGYSDIPDVGTSGQVRAATLLILVMFC